MVKLLGLSGYAQSGKDTAAVGLIKLGWKRLAFADTLRNCLYALDPLVENGTRLRELVDSVGWEKAKQNVEVRRLLQYMGTEVGRNILGDNIWVDTTFSQMEEYAVGYVITDVRFVNEAKAIQARGGKVIRIERSGVTAPNDHPSEHALRDFHFDDHIFNDGSIRDLHSTMQKIVPNL